MQLNKLVSATLASTIMAAGLSLWLSSPTIAKSFDLDRNGTISCSGDFGGVGTQETEVWIANRNTGISLRIETIRVYDIDGNLVYNSDVDGFTPGAKTSLSPRNSDALSWFEMVSIGSGVWTGGPGLIEIDWRTQGAFMALPLSADAHRKITGSGGSLVGERAVHCQAVPRL